MTRKEKLINFFQNFGKSMMTPIAIMAAVGIIIGFTAALNRKEVADLLPFMNNRYISYVLLSIRDISLKVFDLIPVLFAISLGFGLAKKEKQIAALAGFVGYYVLMYSSSVLLNAGIISYAEGSLATVLGITTINMGALGGIIAGIGAAKVHNKYYNLKLPVAISFFGGKRSVAIITIFVMAVLGQIMPFIWFPITKAINFIGFAINSLGALGTFGYGFLERIMLPTGLHHVVISLFRTTSLGGSTTVDGTLVEGALNCFYALVGKVPTAELAQFTKYMGQGRIALNVFGLPAAALAMYKITDIKRRKFVKPLLIAGVLACFTTGITEPVEYLFLFTAPILFLFHAVMSGISFMIMGLLGVVIGNTQGGIIDLVVYGILVDGSKWYYILPVGAAYSLIYYNVYKWYLSKKKVVIAEGVENESDENIKSDITTNSISSSDNKSERAKNIVEGLGGKENIEDVYNCITRLRVDIKDIALIDEDQLMKTKALGISKVSNKHIQVIYGSIVEEVAEEVKDELGID